MGSTTIAHGSKEEAYSTGELARAADTTLRTVRFYEEAGLLQASRRCESSQRTFAVAELRKLKLIVDLRATGLSLESIKSLFALKDTAACAKSGSAELRTALQTTREELKQKIALLNKMHDELVQTVDLLEECGACAEPQFPPRCGNCGVFQRPEATRAFRLLWGKK